MLGPSDIFPAVWQRQSLDALQSAWCSQPTPVTD